MIEQLRSGLRGDSIKSTLAVYVVGIALVLPLAVLIWATRDESAAFQAIPLLVLLAAIALYVVAFHGRSIAKRFLHLMKVANAEPKRDDKQDVWIATGVVEEIERFREHDIIRLRDVLVKLKHACETQSTKEIAAAAKYIDTILVRSDSANSTENDKLSESKSQKAGMEGLGHVQLQFETTVRDRFDHSIGVTVMISSDMPEVPLPVDVKSHFQRFVRIVFSEKEQDTPHFTRLRDDRFLEDL